MTTKTYGVGNLVKDPIVRQGKDGKTIVNFSLACQRDYGNDEVDFHNMVAFGGLAENIAKYLKKGSKIYFEGTLQNRSYEKDGEKRWVVEILVRNCEFLTPKSTQETSQPTQPRLEPIDENQLPF